MRIQRGVWLLAMMKAAPLPIRQKTADDQALSSSPVRRISMGAVVEDAGMEVMALTRMLLGLCACSKLAQRLSERIARDRLSLSFRNAEGGAWRDSEPAWRWQLANSAPAGYSLRAGRRKARISACHDGRQSHCCWCRIHIYLFVEAKHLDVMPPAAEFRPPDALALAPGYAIQQGQGGLSRRVRPRQSQRRRRL